MPQSHKCVSVLERKDPVCDISAKCFTVPYFWHWLRNMMLGTQDETTSIHAIFKLPTWRLPQSSRLTSLCREDACCLQRNSSEGEVRCMTHRHMDAIKGAAAKPVRHTGSVWGSGFLVPGKVFLVPVVFFSRNGVFGSREGSLVPRVFSVPGLGCFQFPDSGLMFPEWCVGCPWVFSVPGMVFPVPGQRGRHGGVCGSRMVFRVPMRVPPLLRCFFVASSCFFLLLLASLLSFASLLPSFLPSFHLSSFPPLLPCFLSFSFLSSVPAFPLPSLPPPALPLIFFRSFLFLLPALASFPSLIPFPYLFFCQNLQLGQR